MLVWWHYGLEFDFPSVGELLKVGVIQEDVHITLVFEGELNNEVEA